MKDFFSSWNFFRWFRLVGGLGLLTYGAIIVDWPIIIIGTMVGWMAISNSGCSPFSSSCEVEPRASKKDERLLEDN